MDDYHAFTSTTGSSDSGGSGCSAGCLLWVLGVIAVLYLMGKLFA